MPIVRVRSRGSNSYPHPCVCGVHEHNNGPGQSDYSEVRGLHDFPKLRPLTATQSQQTVKRVSRPSGGTGPMDKAELGVER